MKKQKQTPKQKLWFKKSGVLCTPSTWQGYLILIIYAILMYCGFQNWDHEAGKNLFFIIIFTLVLLYIVWKKGDKKIWVVPNWKWR